jgi:hypothetical protein
VEKTEKIARVEYSNSTHCCTVVDVHLFQDFAKLSSFLQKNYNTTLEKKDLSVRGWNWGLANFIGE